MIDDNNVNNAVVDLLESNNSINDLLIELCIWWNIYKNDI